MAKRNFAAIVGVTVLVLLAGDVRAQQVSIEVDGCAMLARAVYEEVSAAALYGPGKSGPWLINPRQAEISECKTTARTVSRAFTSAMSSAGIKVDWGSNRARNGDYCLSHILSQCYPNRDPHSSMPDSANASFVRQSWAVVSQSVMRAMANPFSSDEIRFRSDDLKLNIGLSLRTIDADRRQ